MDAEIRNAQGEKLDYAYHSAQGDCPFTVIIGHGVTANMNRPFVEALAKGLAITGIPALRFSFSGNGDSEGRFEDSCVSKEVEDLGAVIDSVKAQGRRIAYVGHSMGGGMVIDVAAGLALQSPGEVKAVVAIAPWNGVQPTPSSVVSGLSAPLLILCSMSDALCPCSGEVQLTDTQGLLSGSVTPGIPLLFGSSADPTWHGGAMAIFRNAPNAIVMDVDKVSHFTIAGIDDGSDMQDFADWARGATGLNFNRPDRPYNDIPTMEYAVAFLNQAFELDRQAGEALLNAASSDARLVDIQRSN